MAWPLTPLETDVAGVTIVHASLANSLQQAINWLFGGLRSIVALVVDGTGGVVVTGTPGTVKVGAGASGATLPNTAIASGEIYKESTVRGWANVDVELGGALTVNWGFNIQSVTRNMAAGDYTVVFNYVPPAAQEAVVLITCIQNALPSRCWPSVSIQDVDGSGRLRIRFLMQQTAGTGVDTGFSIIAFGA